MCHQTRCPESRDQIGEKREFCIFTRTKDEHIHDNSSQAIVGGAEAGLCSCLRGRGDDVGSLLGLVQARLML